jgi:hypothetical protein
LASADFVGNFLAILLDATVIAMKEYRVMSIMRNFCRLSLAVSCLAWLTPAWSADDAKAEQNTPANKPQAQFDEVCTKHMADTNPATHDPAIQKRVERFALQLLAGDPHFMAEWNAYNQEMRKGTPNPAPNAPDLPNADVRQADAAVDLHCFAPIEARLLKLGGGNIKLDVDDWRSYVFASIALLDQGKYTSEQASDLINKVRQEDRKEAAADFTRDCLLSAIPYEATTKPDGTIVVTPKIASSGMR